MLIIQYDWKTYQPKWTFCHVETILDWISCGEIELLPEKSTDKEDIEAKTPHVDDTHVPKSIITKLREWEREERDDALSILVIWLLNRLSYLLTSLEEEKETEEVHQQIREVIVPEFDYADCCDQVIITDWVQWVVEQNEQIMWSIWVQVEALTKAVQALQKHPLFNNQK